MEVITNPDITRYWKDVRVYLEMNADKSQLVVTVVHKTRGNIGLAQFDRGDAGEGQSSPQIVM